MTDDSKPRPVQLRVVRRSLDAVPSGKELPPGGGDPLEPDLRPVEFSDDALAKALSADLGDDWRHVPERTEWYRWTGKRWEVDKSLLVLYRSRMVCRAQSNACASERLARQVSSKGVIYAAAKLAGEDRQHATPFESFDVDPWLLNTPGGVVDLRTGRRREHAREQMMTHMTSAAPEGEAPHFFEFLNQCTQGDRELQAYLKRVAGYCHTGSVEEHAMFFIHGAPRNGKTTFVELMADSVGDYAGAASMDMFTVAKGERHPEELAILAGKRLMIATETAKGKPWDEGRLKVLTGGDRIRARFMRSNSFEFRPTWKLLLAGNHRPPMRNMDPALRARMNLIPFRQPTIPEGARDKKLAEKLRTEMGGILKWAIEGAVEWGEKGLATPAVVVKATDEYFKAEDILGRWIGQRCVEGTECEASTSGLYRDYRQWAAQVGEFGVSLKRFSEDLEERGHLKALHPKTRQSMFRGVAPLMSSDELPLEPPKNGTAAREHDATGAEDWRHDPADDFKR